MDSTNWAYVVFSLLGLITTVIINVVAIGYFMGKLTAKTETIRETLNLRIDNLQKIVTNGITGQIKEIMNKQIDHSVYIARIEENLKSGHYFSNIKKVSTSQKEDE